jgi:hypothetical protein
VSGGTFCHGELVERCAECAECRACEASQVQLLGQLYEAPVYAMKEAVTVPACDKDDHLDTSTSCEGSHAIRRHR